MILIEYASGRVAEGILMSLQGDRMRIAVRDHDDAIECHLVGGVWITDDGEPVKFKCTLAMYQLIDTVHQSESDTLCDRPETAYTARVIVN